MDQNQPDENHECLLILGMHRSGGALLAGCLHQLGVNLGQSLTSGHGADGDSAFENQDIVLAHEILFRDLGCRWDMVGSLPEGWVESQAAARFEKKLIEILEQQFIGRGPWTVRDPRLCRVMPLWLKVLDRLEITPGIVHLIRHPYEVACSLQQHHTTEMSNGYLLWLVHNRDAMAASRRHPHTLVTYDQLLADPVTTVLRIASTLYIELPRDPLQYSHVLTDFARPDLKHHHTNGNGNRSSKGHFAQFAWVYEQFRLSQAKALSAPNDRSVGANSDALSDFPLAVALESTPQARAARGHAAAMFNDLLGMIGHFEQSELDQHQQRQRRLLAAGHVAETLYAQIYFPLPGQEKKEYSEDGSRKMLLAPNEWQPVTWDIPRPEDLHTGQLRLDPLNTRGIVSVSSIKIVHAVTEEAFWAAENAAQFAQCTVEGDGLVLPDAQSLVIVCTGNNASLCLPTLPDLPDCPLKLIVWIKASRNQTLMEEAWTQLNLEKSGLDQRLEKIRALLEEARQKAQTLQNQLAEKTGALEVSQSDWKKQEARQQSRIEALQRQQNETEQALRALQDQAKARSAEQTALLQEAQAQKAEVQQRLQSLESQLRDSTAALQQKEAERQKQDARHHAQIDTLQQSYQENLRARESLQEQWQDKANQLADRLKEAQQQQDDGQARVKDLQEQLRVKKAEIKAVEAQRQEQGQRHQQQIAALESTVADQKQMISALEKKHCQQEELSRQYYQALQDAEETNQDHVDTLERQMQQKEATLERLENRLNDKDGIIARQSIDLIDAEKEAAANRQLKQANRQLNTWMQDLQSAFQALIASRRWKFGHAAGRALEILRFRGPGPTGLDQIQGIFGQFIHTPQPETDPPLQTGYPVFHDGEVLISWMQQLQNDFPALVGSHRWRWGNAAVRLAEMLLLRPKVLLAPTHMTEVFAQFEDWHKNGLSARSGRWLSREEILQLNTWLNALEQDFHATMACRRWRLGSKMVRLVQILSFRRQVPLVTDHMHQIFEDYRNQNQYSNSRS